MAQFSPKINQFIEVLESYEYLLHAETQAIAAKEIDLIDSLNDKKDVCIAKLKLLNDQFTQTHAVSQLLTVSWKKFLTFKKEISVLLVYWLKIKELKEINKGLLRIFLLPLRKLHKLTKKNIHLV